MVAIMKSPLSIALSLVTVLTPVWSAGTFTPEAMLSVDRRGAAVPNAAGTLAFSAGNQYNFTTHKRKYYLNVLDLATGSKTLISNSSADSNPVWLPGTESKFAWFHSEDDGSTTVNVGDAATPDAEPFAAGSIPGSVDGLKIAPLANGTYAVVFMGTAAPNGTLYNSELAEEPITSGRMYTQIFVRHWDTYVTPMKNSIWYSTLSVGTSNSTSGYTLSAPINALNGTGLESPVPPMGSTDNYDISPAGIAFVAKDPKLNQATTTKSDVYYIPLKTFKEAAPSPKVISTPHLQGASTSPAFAPNGHALSFVRMKGINYESDKNRLLMVPDVTKGLKASEFYADAAGVGAWDRSPNTIYWSPDSKTLYLVVEERARTRMFTVPADPAVTALPSLIYADSASEGHVVDSGKILVTGSSYLDNSIYSWVDPVAAAASNATSGIDLISANLGYGAKWGLSRSQISEIYYQGDSNYTVHAWVIKPSFFKENQTYPLAFYVHGGPQGSTADAWSNRWNMMVFAEQGYVVVAFNPTGSTGFGQNLTDRIQNNWGGAPYNDLVLGYEYIEANLPYVDTNRSIELGASYGGYMGYWIAGHDLGKKFKAQFVHDGSFNTLSQYASEELWFMQHDFNGTLWDNYDNYARWNPAAHTKNWTTPMLINHNDLDYRLPIAEGLAAFNVLQAKGIDSKFLNFPDENHWVLKPENNLIWHKTVLDWLNGYVGLPRYSKEGDEVYEGTLMNGPWSLYGNTTVPSTL